MKKKDKIEKEVFVTKVFKCPNILTGKNDYTVFMEDENNEYVWNTISRKMPEENKKYFLKAVVTNTDEQGRGFEKKVYGVGYCIFKELPEKN